MKKSIFLFLLIIMLFMVTGCGKYTASKATKDLEKKIGNLKSYRLTGELEITNNDDVYNYDVDVSYKKKDKYSFLNFIKYIKNNNLKKLRYYNLSGVAYGIVESSISTLIVILTIMTFKTSLNLGVLTTIFAIFSVVSLTIYNKVCYNNISI